MRKMDVLEISESQGSLQGDVCAASPSLLLQNECFNVSEVFQNGLSEDLESQIFHSRVL